MQLKRSRRTASRASEYWRPNDVRILIDECVPRPVVDRLRVDHDVVWARETAPGDNDLDVLARSVEEGRILVSTDYDFGDLVFRLERPAVAVVLLVIANPRLDLVRIADDVAKRLAAFGEDRLVGMLTVIEADRTRQRALPAQGDRA